jgi:hypothetical protein
MVWLDASARRVFLLSAAAALAGCKATPHPQTLNAADMARAIGAPAPTQNGPCPHVPPPLKSKTPLPPVSGFKQMLAPGHWDWDDGDYVWTQPHWMVVVTARPPKWIDARWQSQGGACVWLKGHFTAAR